MFSMHHHYLFYWFVLIDDVRMLEKLVFVCIFYIFFFYGKVEMTIRFGNNGLRRWFFFSKQQ